MATILTKVRGSIATLLSTDLNSLANNALAIAGSAYSGSGGYPFAEIELVATFASSPNAGTGVAIWFLREVDGTNYEDGGTSLTPSRSADLVIPAEVLASAQRITVDAQIPAGSFKALLKNDATGQALTSSGNTLKIRPWTYQTS